MLQPLFVPLVEAVSRNQAAPVLERFSVTGRSIDGVDSCIDGLETNLDASADREQALSAGAYSSASHRFCGAASTALRQGEALTGLSRTPVIPILAEDGEPLMPTRRRS